MNAFFTRRDVLARLGGVAAGTFSLCSASAAADVPYPDRAIKLIVPWSAGGSTDVLARAVGQNLGELLGKPVVIDNRPGASGRLGVDALTKSPADGYTAAVIELAHAIAPSVFQKTPYDIMNDTAAVSMLGASPLVLFVDAEAYREGQYQKFVSDARKSADPFTLATSGNGSISHLAAGLFSRETGLPLDLIPYKGSAPALTDVAARIVKGHFCTLASASALFGAGKIVPLMVTGNRRIPQLPQTPCAAELRLGRMDFGQWWALVVPARTPRPVIEILHRATATSLADKRVQARISALAIDLGSRPADDTMSFVRAEAAKWAKVVTELGIKPE